MTFLHFTIKKAPSYSGISKVFSFFSISKSRQPLQQVVKSRKQSFTQVSKSDIQFKDIKVWDLLGDLLCSGICSAS